MDIVEICEAAIADLNDLALDKNLELILQVPATRQNIYVDSLLIRRVIDNLLSNAIKFSPSHTQVTLIVDYLGKKGLRLQVADLGLGVSDSLRQSIFEKYEVGTLMKGISQTGLGLAFCKIVVESHGGRITVVDNLPQGSIFTVEIDD